MNMPDRSAWSSHTRTNPAELRELHRLAKKLSDDNPGRRVSVDRGTVWITGDDGGKELGIYSVTLLNTVVACWDPDTEMTPLHRAATAYPASGDRCLGCGAGTLKTCRTGCGALHCDCGYFSLLVKPRASFGDELLGLLTAPGVV